MYVVLNVIRPGLVREAATLEEAASLAEQFAADDPGQNYDVYELVSRSFGEPPAKTAISVATRDKYTVEAELAVATTARKEP